MKLSVSTKMQIGEWGEVRAHAYVSKNPFYGFNEPGEPEHDIEELCVRDSKNRVIHGRDVIRKNTMVCSLEDWEISIIEERIIQAYHEAEEMEEDRKVDLMIETVRVHFS